MYNKGENKFSKRAQQFNVSITQLVCMHTYFFIYGLNNHWTITNTNVNYKQYKRVG